MKRIFFVAVATLMVAMAAPAHAKAEHIEGTIEIPDEGTVNFKGVVTPSDRANGHGKFRPAERQGAGGGGANHFSAEPEGFLPVGPDSTPGEFGATSGKSVETPSGNFNSTFHGV